jgi:hypothetical protein
MDSARAKFYWDASVKKKYHILKWEVLTKTKEFCGLAFIDIKLMNQCLVSKWIVKLGREREEIMTCAPLF